MAEKQGFVLSFCKAVRVKYFMLCKSLRSAAKNDAPCRFLNALVQIPVVKYRKTKRTSEFACPLYPSEKQGFVLAFCKAVRVKYFYALQKPSVSR